MASDGQVVIDLSMRKDEIQSDIAWLESNLKNLGANVDADQISEKFEDAMNKTKHTVNETIESIDDKKAKPKISADDSSLKEKTSESSEKLNKLNDKKVKSKISADNSNLDAKVSESKSALDKIPKNKKTTISVQDEASEPTKKIGTSLKETSNKSKGFTEALKGTAVGMGVYQAAMAAGSAISNEFAGAVSRFDTLNNFPKVLQSMGVSADDANQAMKTLKQGVDGLPTSLDEVAKTTQTFIPLSKNAQDASKSALALNDAFLASGASSEDASRGLQQYTQMLARGKVDQEGWYSITETMNPALQKVAKSFGIASGSTQELYEKLKSGQITMQDLNTRFQELDKGVNGFHETALASTAGIGTAFQNVGNRIKASMQEAIGGFDKFIKKLTGKSIAQNINSWSAQFSNFGKNVGKAFEVAGNAIKPFASALSPLKPLLPIIADGLKGVTVALLAFGTMTAIPKVISGIASAFKVLNATMMDNPYVAVAAAIIGLGTALVSLYKHNAKFRDFVNGIVKSIGTLINNITKVAQKITKDFVGAFNKMSAPIKKAFSSIMKYIEPDLKNLQKTISSVMKNIQKTWDSAWKEMQKVVTPILKTISKFVDQHMKQIKNIINSVMKIISTIWNTTWKQIENVFKLVWDLMFHKSRVVNDIKNIITTAIKATQSIWKNVWNAIKNYFDIVWDAIKDIAKSAINWVKGVIEGTIKAIQNTWNSIWNAIKSFVDGIWNGIKGIVSNAINAVHDTISNVLNSISDVWHSMWQSLSDFFGSIWKDIKKFAQDGINGVLSVINAGIDGIDAVWKFFTGKETSIHHLKPVKFAQGGIVDRHLSMVNDGDGADWKELIETPDGELMMSNERNAVLPLEPGTRVYNGAETKQIMSMLGVDRYANGGFVGGIQRFKDGGVVGDLIDWGSHKLSDIGSWIKDKWDAITKFLKHPIENTKAIISKAITDPLKKLSNSNMVNLGKGVFDKLTKPIADWFKKGLEEVKKKHDEETSVGGFGSIKDMKNSDDLKKLVKAALEANGLSTSQDMIDKVMRQIATESGGNAHAVQPGADPDGDGSGPAMGLMQTKRSTFNAYKAPGHDDIFNAYDNLLAALNYAKHRYGPNLSFLGQGHGYDNGGVVDEKQLAWIAENNREFVINPQRMTADALLKQAAEERLAYDPNSEIAKAITGMNIARNNNGTIVPNTILTSQATVHSNSVGSSNQNSDGVGNIIVDVDGQTVAKASYPYIQVLQGQDVRLQTRKGGTVYG